MVNISRYRIKETDYNVKQVISYEINVCPICAGGLKVIGSRSRMVIDGGGTTQSITIRRLRCGTCGKIHHELPDIVIPYKRYCAETIEKIIAGEEKSVSCDGKAIWRIRAWWAACILYFESVMASLREKYGVEINVSAPKEIVRAVVNAHLWPHTRSAYTPV
jgi:hypothetical protein